MGEAAPGIPPEVGELAGAGGWKAAIDQAVDRQLEDILGGRREPGQMALLDLPAIDGAEPGDIARGVGRPRGRANNKTLDIGRVIDSYGDPLQFLAQLYSTPLPVILHQLGLVMRPHMTPTAEALVISRAMEVLKLQAWAAKEVAPYRHSKMPLKISTEGDQAAVVINFVTPEQARALSTADPNARLKIVADQGLSEFEPPPFDGSSLDRTAQVTDSIDQSAPLQPDRRSDAAPLGTSEDAAHASRAAPPTPQAANSPSTAPVAHGIFPRDGQRPSERAEPGELTDGRGGTEPPPSQGAGQGQFFDFDEGEGR